MSKRSINYKRNRKKPKRSSPGGTPGPFGRIQQTRGVNEIVKEINRLKTIDKLQNSIKKEINKSMEMKTLTKSPSKLLPNNINKQLQAKMHSALPLQQQKIEKQPELREIAKFDQSHLISRNLIPNMSVKERAQIYETVARANESTVLNNNNQLDNYSLDLSVVCGKMHQTDTPMPKYHKT
uniref:Uncharacterized protein n=1 Tax=Setaria digitata TaxID=48799 RepID=A0A915PX92_9BILA